MYKKLNILNFMDFKYFMYDLEAFFLLPPKWVFTTDRVVLSHYIIYASCQIQRYFVQIYTIFKNDTINLTYFTMSISPLEKGVISFVFLFLP